MSLISINIQLILNASVHKFVPLCHNDALLGQMLGLIFPCTA